MTIGNELWTPIAPIIDDRFLQTTKTGSGIGADVFETQRLDNVDHIVRTTSVRGENLSFRRRARSLLRSPSGRPNDRSRARQHPFFRKFRRSMFPREGFRFCAIGSPRCIRITPRSGLYSLAKEGSFIVAAPQLHKVMI